MEPFKRPSIWALCWVGLGLAVNNRKTLNKSGLNKLAVHFFLQAKVSSPGWNSGSAAPSPRGPTLRPILLFCFP